MKIAIMFAALAVAANCAQAAGEPIWIQLASGRDNTTIYLDGSRIETHPNGMVSMWIKGESPASQGPLVQHITLNSCDNPRHFTVTMSIAYEIKEKAMVTDNSIEEHDISPGTLMGRAVNQACAYKARLAGVK